ncbi:putative glycosyl hydrolase [Anaerohalosphaera lusitana]|uniref:Trehalose 6-phosphate phosphatase n=1 Tax=Anaerohalosphaera lusitana TaxID=1936003 RepID=A0A1U9NLK5_9BACT|nr:trehalose-phosphatase [Anaerohalosphaera lusitana]AQT68450.1 putative glycosyl hydrolase [Anaerohalosphaera lusitana]
MSNETKLTITADKFDAVIFDMDGVITETAKTHASAWKQLFDEYLKDRAEKNNEEFKPFSIEDDYLPYVDGKPRYDGVKSFLQSRRIDIPWGSPSDDPSAETVCGLGNRKNDYFLDRLKHEGAKVYPDAKKLVTALRNNGIAVAVISASKNSKPVLEAAGVIDLFDTSVDGNDARRQNLKGKPEPDVFIEAAKRLNTTPDRSIVVEDAIAGVQAGAQGKFATVIGVARNTDPDSLSSQGADIVVTTLDELTTAPAKNAAVADPMDPAECAQKISDRAGTRKPAVFLDYDGTLTPIVEHPEDATLSPEMADALIELNKHCTVAIVSGRDLADVRSMVNLDQLIYAGSHGFDIQGPHGMHIELQKGEDALPHLEIAHQALQQKLHAIPNARIERKKFAIAVHYRQVPDNRVDDLLEIGHELADSYPQLKLTGGKKIFELRPNVEWDKGSAVLWLLEKLELDPDKFLPIYIGDDLTDEDAFKALKSKGVGIMVSDEVEDTAADYVLTDTEQTRIFLEQLAQILARQTA